MGKQTDRPAAWKMFSKSKYILVVPKFPPVSRTLAYISQIYNLNNKIVRVVDATQHFTALKMA